MRLKYINLIFLTGALAAGCGASKEQAMLDTIGSPQVRPSTFQALNEDFAQAEAEQVNLIAPQKFLKAKEALRDAEAGRSSGQTSKKVEESLAQARRQLDDAVVFAKENRQLMMPLITARANALQSGAGESTNQDLKDLENRYLTIASDLNSSRGKAAATKAIPRLTRDYEQLTSKAYEARYLGEAINNIRIAKSEDAEEWAPKTLRDSEAMLESAKAFIQQNPNAESTEKMSEMGLAATDASRRLLAMTREARTTKGLSAEEIALRVEKKVQSAAEESEELKKSLDQKNRQVTALQKKSEAYSEIEERNRVNQRFEEARALFQEDEANIFRQGDSLVISLKKLSFPSGQTEIPSSSFGLLKKVESAIKEFKDPVIVIEGHTDSTGNEKANKALSQERAEAVKSYLLSSGVSSAEKILTVGHGAEKPLASNKSNPGRAMNRRIDVIIKE